MVLLVSGSAFTRRRALRSSAPRSMESAYGPACHGGGHARPSGSLRGRGATRALLERINMRNLFPLTVTMPNRPACLLVADPCSRAEPARGPPLSHHLIFFDCFFKSLRGIVSTLPRVSQRPSQHEISQHDIRNAQAIELQSRSRFRRPHHAGPFHRLVGGPGRPRGLANNSGEKDGETDPGRR